MADQLLRALAPQANLRFVSAVTTETVLDGARRHGWSPGAAVAAGRALTCGALLASLTNDEERVTVQIVGNGPVGSVTVDAWGIGNVRAYVTHPKAEAVLHDGAIRTAEVVGRQGVVNIVRDLGLRELYQGQVEILTGEIDEDIEGYLRISEQIPSALGCEVLLRDGEVEIAAGILVQALPDGDVDAIREIQHALRTGQLIDLLRDGVRSPDQIAASFFPQEPLNIMTEINVQFACKCSADRVVDMMKLLGQVELDEMIAENRPAEVTCNFCNTLYQVQRDELEKVRTEIAGPRQNN